MHKFLALLIVVVVFALVLPADASAERRVALVIGNAAYKTSPLKNPANDARDMATALKGLGFDVRLITDATMQQMETAVREFGKDLRLGGVGLFYYAGHGVQVNGENFLVPVNAAIHSESDVKYGCLNAGLVLGKMEDAENGLNLVILDACRSNPYARGFRSAEQGLAKMDAPTGSLIAYSTAPGSVASDGSGRNGVYTRFLLETIKTPGLPISEVFMRVRQRVVKETAKKQVPWEASSLIGQFYFAGGTQVASLEPSSSAPSPSVAPAPSFPRPGAGKVDLSDIDAAAVARNKGEVAARKEWEARLKSMQGDYAKLQGMEKNAKYSSQLKAQAWERFVLAYSDNNPYTEEDKSLRDKAAERQQFWTASVANDPSKVPVSPVGSPEMNWRDPVTGMDFVWIPGGCFQMGSPSHEAGRNNNEGPVHQVCVSSFWMSKYAVTNAEYRVFNPRHSSGVYWFSNLNEDKQPVVMVSWEDAKAYAQWLSRKENGKFRLPTEAEWEYASRAGTLTSRFWGDNPDYACTYANVADKTASLSVMPTTTTVHACDDGFKLSAPVGSFRPNAFGLYDMLGNVWQWCEDAYKPTAYSSHARQNPLNKGSGSERVYRGGGWDSTPSVVRSAYRAGHLPTTRGESIGFRLVKLN